MPDSTELRIVGTPFRRVDGVAKVTGRTLFADDLTFPRMVHLKRVRSHVPHATIKKIDTSAAEKIEGVIHFVTPRICRIRSASCR